MEVNLWMTLLIGLTLGIKHALEPDHVIAVSTIVSRSKKLWTSAILGVLWGVGHTLTLFVIGMLFIVMKKEIPMTWAMTLEFMIGILLVYLGITHYFSANTNKTLNYAHPENKFLHSHDIKESKGKMTKQYLRSIFIGFAHGMSGSAGMILLTMTTVKDPYLAGLYIMVFGVGTSLGMLLCTTLIGVPFAMSSNNGTLNIGLTRLAGVVSFIFSLYYMYDIGVHEGLFKIWLH